MNPNWQLAALLCLYATPEAESRGKRQSGRELLRGPFWRTYQFSCVELPLACASSANECLSAAADWKITGEVLSRRALEWSLCSRRNDCDDLGEEKNKYICSRTRSLGFLPVKCCQGMALVEGWRELMIVNRTVIIPAICAFPHVKRWTMCDADLQDLASGSSRD